MNKRVKIFVRLDDACPTMDKNKWDKFENILDKYGIKPMVGIIPFCEDPNLLKNDPDEKFWDKAIQWQEKGWSIALHGYNHVYLTDDAGINSLWKRSEFAGVPLEEQKEKIRKGYNILKNRGITPKYFFAPSHTFDLNTISALLDETDIRIISDTWGLEPYRSHNIIFIPQQMGHFSNIRIPGYWTICFHPNNMTDQQFEKVEKYISNNKENFETFEKIELNDIGKKGIFSRMLTFAYFLQRKLRGIQ